MKRTSLVFFILLQANSAFGQDGMDNISTSRVTGLAERGPAVVETRIEPGSIQFGSAEIDALIKPPTGAEINFPSIDRFTGNESDPLQFRPVTLFARGARVRVIADNQTFEQPIGPRRFYIANNRSTGIGLAVDPQTGKVSGFAVKGGGRLQIEGDFVTQLEFVPIEEPPDGSNSCGNGEYDLSQGSPGFATSPSAMSVSASEAGDVISYQAVIAVDTDSEWLDGFSDDTVVAMNWITDLFLAMNVFYERDVETRLLIGDVTLRTGTDPYTVPSDRFAQLSEFGQYWMENMGHVERQFAALFSGRGVSAYYFSGIAWIDNYCAAGRWVNANGGQAVAGSYSYNAIGASRTPANTALYIGHELGHNMGSPHTHCYSPVVDQCYNAEVGCYSGTPLCPADGQGTIMSYCHVGGVNGANCGSSKTEFHPTVQARLENRLATELVVGCILPYTEPEPEPQFASDPAAGALLDFGDQFITTSSPNATVTVQNLGSAELLLSCSLSGPGAAQFTIQACVLALDPGQAGVVQVNCMPAALGAHQAKLTLLTNDADDPSVEFNLSCNAVSAPLENVIFRGGFED